MQRHKAEGIRAFQVGNQATDQGAGTRRVEEHWKDRQGLCSLLGRGESRTGFKKRNEPGEFLYHLCIIQGLAFPSPAHLFYQGQVGIKIV
jgi:hypothetical protein